VIRKIKQALARVHSVRSIVGGRNPWFNIFHFQYLASYQHNAWLKTVLPGLSGALLDFGCGAQPYRELTSASHYLGLDIPECASADIHVRDGWQIPLADHSCDGLMSTQAIEHVPDLNKVVAEWVRVLKPGSPVVVTMPFMFHLHGAPFDFRRFTEYGITKYFSDRGFEVVETQRFGGIGSYLVVGFQDAVESQPGAAWVLLRVLTLPIFVLYTPLLNLFGAVVDRIDRSNSFYTSIGVRMVSK
jgi:SAM-dependent methyltransferase